jgi:hypothetical protein
MSNKPILVLKDIQTLQTVGASKRPSFMGMLRTAITGRDREGSPVGRMRRLGNVLGVGAKTAAGAGAALQAAHSMQGGNLAAPLQIGQMYEGLDPTGSFSQGYNENFGQGDSVAGRNNAARRFVQQEQARLGPQQITTSTAGPSTVGNVTVSPPVSGATASTPPAPQQITTPTAGVAGTPSTGTPHQITTPTTAPATSTMSPQVQAGTAMSSNPPQQTGPMMFTQAPPAGNPSLVQPVAEQLAQTTGRPMQTPGGPAVPQQTPGVQTRLPRGGPLNALPPNMSSPAQQRGPPPAQSSIVSHPMAVRQESVQSPMDQAMASLNQTPSAHSTANPMTLAQANALMGQNITGGPKSYGVGVNDATFGNLANWNEDPSLGGQYGEQFSQYGQNKNTNRGIGDQVYWQKMLKAYISYLYTNMGSYLYKMTPHEAGIFAVDTFFKMRE